LLLNFNIFVIMRSFGLFLLLGAVTLCVSAAIPDKEYQALKAIYTATNGQGWINNEGWLKDGTNPCTDWFGVTCTSDGNNIQSLSLSNNNLVGQIPEEIGDLTAIISVDFGLNKLSGPLPKSFSTLSKMYAMSLKENQFTGPLDFSQMTGLQFAHLDFNSFSGTLNSFCPCSTLKVLGLVNNQMYGQIPDCFVGLTQLQTLQLGGNKLSGPIPAFSAESLRALDLSRNAFSGAPAFSKLMAATGITELDFFGNKLSGPISGLSGHGSLVVFDVHDNKMTGTIPDDYALSMRNLYILRAQKNNLYGFLPSTFSNSSIPSFDFSDNQLYCPLPPLPDTGAATCSYWTMDLANPSRCTIGQVCYVVVMGSGFVVGENAMCNFGDVSVAATIVSNSELRCVVVPNGTARTVPLSISVGQNVVTSNTLQFEFASPSVWKPNPLSRRSSNADPVHVRIHGESKCPDFGSIVTIFKDIVSKLSTDVLDLQLGFILKEIPDYPTGFWSLHGQSEVIGNGMIKCVEKSTDVATAVKFSACLAETIDRVPTNAAECARRLGIDFSGIPQCALNATGKELLKDSMILADNDGAVWSPTIVINDQTYCLWHSTPCKAEKPEDFLRAICDAYTGPTPDACK